MKRTFSILLIVAAVLQGQDIFLSAYKFEYIKAAESAINGHYNRAKTILEEIHKYERRYEPLVYIRVCDDVLNKRLSRSAGEYIFKGVKSFHEVEPFSATMFYMNRAYGIQPEYPNTFLIRGLMHGFKDEYKKAIFEFTKAAELTQNDSLVYFFRGLSYKLLEDYPKALADFKTSLKINPSFIRNYTEIFKIYYTLKNYPQAFSYFQKAYNLVPGKIQSIEYSAMLNTIGIKFKQNQDYDNALIAFEMSSGVDERWAEPHLNRGVIYRMQANYDSALSAFDKSIKLAPDSPDGYYQRALTYQKINALQKAEKDLIRVLFLDNEHSDAYFALAKLYHKQGLLDKAIYNFQKSIETNEKNIWARYWLGYCYDRQKKYKKALSYYSDFVRMAPDKSYKQKISAENRINKLKNYLRK